MGADDHMTTETEQDSEADIPEGLQAFQEMDQEEREECLQELGLDYTTESERERHPLTNDLGFILVTVIYLGIWSWLHYQGADVLWVMDLTAALAFLTAVVWSFGKGAAEAAGDLLGGDQT